MTSNKKAFSLIELIIIIGLMATVSTLCISNWDVLSEGFGSQKPLEVELSQAIHEARYLASTRKDRIWLCYEESISKFVITNLKNESLLSESRPLGKDKDNAPSIKFFPVDNQSSFDSKPKADSTEVDDIIFDPDGSSMPIIAEIKTKSSTKLYYLDPFSSQPLSLEEF